MGRFCAVPRGASGQIAREFLPGDFFCQTLAVIAAEIGVGAAAPRLIEFRFLTLVIGELFLGVGGVGIAGSEHGVGAAGFFFLFAQAAKFVANLAQRDVNGFHLDEQVADFFQEIVKVVGAKDVRKPGRFEALDVLSAAQGRNHVKDTKAAAFVDGDGGEFAEDGEDGAIERDLSDVCDDQRPLGGFKFGEKELCVGDNADAPTFGIENLANGVATGCVSVEHENTDRTRRKRLGRGRHFGSIAPGSAVLREKGKTGT